MASNSQVWKINSTKIENGVIKVYNNGKYKTTGGNNKLSTITGKNKTGYVKLDPDSSNPLVKKLSYAVQNDGKITYLYEDGTGNRVQYNSIQEIANGGLRGYNADTTKLIKTNLQGKLEKSASDAKIPGAANPNADANNDGDVDDEGDDADKNNDADKGGPSGGDINAVITGVENAPSGQFAYPLDIGTATAVNLDRIKFIQGRVKGKEIPKTPSLNTNFQRGTDFEKWGNSSVTIGIQPQISDSTSVKWNGSNLNNLQAFAASASMAIAGATDSEGNPSLSGAVKTAENIAAQLYGSVTSDDDIAKALRTYFGAKAAGIDGGALLSRTSGAVLNPNLELLFEGPDLRQFNYTFKMSAESQSEATAIKNIIWWFKKGMSIRRQESGSSLFLTTPNVFRIRYIQGETDTDHPGINRVKDCALLNCSVNYTPEGNYSTFKDGTMTMYEMTLSFGELSPIYSENYGESPTGSIGW